MRGLPEPGIAQNRRRSTNYLNTDDNTKMVGSTSAITTNDTDYFAISSRQEAKHLCVPHSRFVL
jgi:hypothetical protein